MPLFEIKLDPTNRQLRQFGICCLCALPAIGWLWNMSSIAISVLTLLGLATTLVGIGAPRWLKPAFVATALIAMPIGYVAGEIAMLLMYFCIFLPIGVVFRIVGRDALILKRNSKGSTYWKPRSPAKSVESYYRQS